MSPYEGYRFLVVIYCDLSGWVEVKSLHTLFSQAVTDVLWEDIICKHVYFGKFIINGRSENKYAVIELKE